MKEQSSRGAKHPMPGASPKGKEPSLTTRITQSATGLAKTVIATDQESAATLASLAGQVGKSQSNLQGGSASWTNGSALGSASAETSRVNGHIHVKEGFRSGLSDDSSIRDAFSSFMDGTDDGAHQYGEKQASARDEVLNRSHYSILYHGGAVQSPRGHLLDSLDGAEVVEFLSQPGLISDADNDNLHAPFPDEDYNFNIPFEETGLSTLEKEIIGNIRSALPSPPKHAHVAIEHPLNLFPEFLNHFLEDTDGGLARRPLLSSQWHDVLKGYTDEVWGGILSLNQEQKVQIEKVEAALVHMDRRTITRLKMILGHVLQKPEPITTMQSSTHITSKVSAEPVTRTGLQHGKISVPRHDEKQQPDPQSTYTSQGQISTTHSEQREANGLDRLVFHCPWISCHQGFNSAREMRSHAEAHPFLPCPYVGCASAFRGTSEWMQHISEPHHDLQDTRSKLNTGCSETSRDS